MFRSIAVLVCGIVLCLSDTTMTFADHLRLARFHVDVTPPLGTALCDGFIPDASSIDDPLFARGIVFLGAGEPIVLCAVDYVGIGNAGHDLWRQTLARAAGTSTSRVAVQTLHQHDAPGCDVDAEEMLAAVGINGKCCNVPFMKETLGRVEKAVRESVTAARPFTHIGIGHAQVERVASNRRILGDDGKVKIVRYSSTTDPDAIAAPEGVIDSDLKSISFWNHDSALASITYYTTHPQSHYGKGAISSDFVGLARAIRDRDQPKVFHVHFNGASGNVAAGKYNDGSQQARKDLTQRLAAGMQRAWDATKTIPISASDIQWKTEPVSFPLSDRLKNLTDLEKTLLDDKQILRERTRAARDLSYAKRVMSGHKIELTCLRIGPVAMLNLPGESFVEYQLAAQQMAPDLTVCTAAYGDYGPGYIGTTIAYSQGGYETSYVSRTAPDVEAIYMDGIRKLLK